MNSTDMATPQQVKDKFYELAELKTAASEEEYQTKEEYRNRNSKQINRSGLEQEEAPHLPSID
jgi:hypothetical protein